jgi:folylpolyglutamate synthase
VDIRLEHVIFTTYKERRGIDAQICDEELRLIYNTDEDSRPLCDVLEPFQTTWKEHDHNNAKVWCEETIEDALQRTLDINGPEDMFQILVTGSLHLIGGVLSCLKD